MYSSYRRVCQAQPAFSIRFGIYSSRRPSYMIPSSPWTCAQFRIGIVHFFVASNEESIDRHKYNHIGWFVLATNDIKDKVYVLEVHRNKDSAGKWFDDLKNDLDMKRLRIHTTATMEGRAFLQFTALLTTTRLKQVMAVAGWFKNYNLQPQRIYYGTDPLSKKIFE